MPMRNEEHQRNPISGRFPDYTLPEFDVSTFLMGQFLHLKSIEVSQTADFTDFFHERIFPKAVTCQKNGGEK